MKRSFFLFISVFIFFLMVVSISGCEKQKLHTLRGDWEFVTTRASINDTIVIRFSYKDTVYCLEDGKPISDALYMYDYGMSKSYITFTGSLSSVLQEFNGKWIVSKLNKDVLILVTNETAGQTTREFVKVGELNY